MPYSVLNFTTYFLPSQHSKINVLLLLCFIRMNGVNGTISLTKGQFYESSMSYVMHVKRSHVNLGYPGMTLWPHALTGHQ